MEEPNRIEFAIDILKSVYGLHSDYDDDVKIERIYNFLLGDDNIALEESFCEHLLISKERLNSYKKDCWLIVLLSSYKYLCYLSSVSNLSADELEILSDLDSLDTTFTAFYNYFNNTMNSNKIKIMLRRYYDALADGFEQTRMIDPFNVDNAPHFMATLDKYIKKVSALDYAAMIFYDVDEEYSKQAETNGFLEELTDDDDDEDLSYEEDFDAEMEQFDDCDEVFLAAGDDELMHDEESEQLIQEYKDELLAKIDAWLKEYFETQDERNEFVAFLLSYVYAILLKKEKLSSEENGLLELFESKDANYELLVETVCRNCHYICLVLEIFTKYYYDNEMDILTMRDDMVSIDVRERMHLFDEHYPFMRAYQLVDNDSYKLYDDLFARYKDKYPDNYIEMLHQILLDESLFKEALVEMSVTDGYGYHRVLMIRYLLRMFMEKVYSLGLDKISNDEKMPFALLQTKNEATKNIDMAFKDYGCIILRDYELMLEKNRTERKNFIRIFASKGWLRKMALIDPTILGSSLHYCALVETELYIYLENYGEEKTINYIQTLAVSDYEKARAFIKEIMRSIYDFSGGAVENDGLVNIIANLYNGSQEEIDRCIGVFLTDETLIRQLVYKYNENEKSQEISAPYQKKITWSIQQNN